MAGNDRTGSDDIETAAACSEIEISDLEAIRAGLEDLQAGRFRPFTEVDAEFRAKHKIKPLKQDH